VSKASIQEKGELDAFWRTEDPWQYRSTVDDRLRLAELKAALPRREYRRTLDVGCGDGFVTFELPGERVLGLDLSAEALAWARKAAAARPDGARFEFREASVFDLGSLALEPQDLVVITGVLYPQYIARGFAAIDATVQRLLAPGGILVSVHIGAWHPHGFGLTRLVQRRYAYRQYEHVLEVYQR
jgi:SAM-dependent methyltransferase